MQLVWLRTNGQPGTVFLSKDTMLYSILRSLQLCPLVAFLHPIQHITQHGWTEHTRWGPQYPIKFFVSLCKKYGNRSFKWWVNKWMGQLTSGWNLGTSEMRPCSGIDMTDRSSTTSVNKWCWIKVPGGNKGGVYYRFVHKLSSVSSYLTPPFFRYTWFLWQCLFWTLLA